MGATKIFTPSEPSEYILHVIIERRLAENAEVAVQSIAASIQYVKRKTYLPAEHQLTDEQIEKLNHLIHRVIGTIIQHDFKVISKYQSKESYTYYIQFYPTDSAGKRMKIPVKVQFEIRDHLVKNHATEGMLGTNLIVYAVYVGDKTCFDIDGTFIEIKKICDEIKRGDFSSLIAILKP